MPGFDGQPRRTAGWHLRQELGTNQVFAVFPHSAEMSNNGAVRGRLAQGLFETAFARFGNRPVAFDLTQGPFGQQRLTAFPDQPTPGRFRDGYHACLYLGPLEDEVFSPLIPGFFTDDFVQELDRRYQIMFGKGLVEGCRLDRLDGASFTAWMQRDWANPDVRGRRQVSARWRPGGMAETGRSGCARKSTPKPFATARALGRLQGPFRVRRSALAAWRIRRASPRTQRNARSPHRSWWPGRRRRR